jgi:hypothetical protein
MWKGKSRYRRLEVPSVLLSPLTLARDGMHLAGQSRDTYLGSTVDRKNILGLELLLLQKPKIN